MILLLKVLKLRIKKIYSTCIGSRLIALHFVDIVINRFSKKKKLIVQSFNKVGYFVVSKACEQEK